MKSAISLITTALLFLFTCAQAQEPPSPRERDHDHGKREKVRKAIEEAHANPEVAAAQKAAKEAFEKYQALLKAYLKREHPESAEIIENMRRDFGSRPSRSGFEYGPRPDRAPFAVWVLSKSERAQWDAAWKKFREGDTWKRHRELVKTMPREKRRELGKKLRAEVEAAMIEIDPELKPVLEKMKKHPKPRRRGDSDRARDGRPHRPGPPATEPKREKRRS